MAPQIVHADPALALAKVRAVPRGRVPIFLVGDAADEARLRDLADGFFVRPIAPELLLERARAILRRRPASRAGARTAASTSSGRRWGLGPAPPLPIPMGRPKSGPHPARPAGSTLQAAGRRGAGRGAVSPCARRATRTRCWPSWAPGSTRSSTPSWTRPWRLRRRRPTGQGPAGRPKPDAKPRLPPQLEGVARAEFAGEATKKVEPSLLGVVARAPESARARLLARYAPVENGDYFAVLDVPRDASVADLRRAHEKIVRETASDSVDPGRGGRAGPADRRRSAPSWAKRCGCSATRISVRATRAAFRNDGRATAGSGRAPRAVFFGSPAFAVPCLRAVAAATELCAVVSQPDRPAGRGQAPAAPAVKREAEALGVPILQPEKIRTPETHATLAALAADLFVVVAYGRILPQSLLDLPRLGPYNVHASLLPKLRGAAPIQWAIIRGERETGVSIMRMEAGLDTGPVAAVRALQIADDDTTGTLSVSWPTSARGCWSTRCRPSSTAPSRCSAQDDSAATLAPLLAKADGLLNFDQPARLVSAQARGVDPWPGATTMLGGEPLKLFVPRVVEAVAGVLPGLGAGC